MKYLKIKEDELIDLIENLDKIFSFYDIYILLDNLAILFLERNLNINLN